MSDPQGGGALELHRVVDWTEITLTHRCNQRCFFCYEEARNNATQPEFERVKELLQATAGQAEQVVLCGKEILMRRDVPEIVAYAASLDLRPVVFTNGQALARAGLVEELADAGCAGLAVSFHFPDRETFARGARVSPKGFDLIVAGMRRVRDYNLAHPEKPLSISTETDFFALNVGRLAEMRDTMREALEGAPWRMRLASLLPTRTYDIGLDHVLDPLPTRREEIAAFIATQPESIPLGFVKTPLCLLPEGNEHRSLDAQYVYEGTRLSFNHAEADQVGLDTVSISVSRDLAKVMGSHPYRWVCRSCAVAPLCRFERVAWGEPGFEPDRDQRPVPYRPVGVAPAVVDQLIPGLRRTTPEQVLAPLGARTDGVTRAEILGRFLQGRSYPEEEILDALSVAAPEAPGAPEGPRAPVLLDAWAQGAPVLCVSLGFGEEKVDLHLGVPSLGDPHALAGYLDVRPLGEQALSPETWKTCLEHLASLPLPELSRWQEDTWFDAYLGRLFVAASSRLGGALWSGVGGLGPLRTERLSVDEDRALTVHLSGPDGLEGTVLIRGGKSEDAPPTLVVVLLGAATAPEALVLDFAEALGLPLASGELSRWCRPDGALSARDEGEGWTPLEVEVGRSAPDEGPAAGSAHPVGALTIEVSLVERPERHYCFHLAPQDEGRNHYKRVAGLDLWYTHPAQDRVAEVCVGPILAAMAHLDGAPPSAENLERWRECIEAQAVAARLGGRLSWSLSWTD